MSARDPFRDSRGPDGVIGQDADYLEQIADARDAAAERVGDEDYIVEPKSGHVPEDVADRQRRKYEQLLGIGVRHLDANEHRIILAALETYQSMWAVAVSEARKEGSAIDERLAQGRYDEAGELLAKFKRDPEGGSAVDAIGWMNANIAAEQASDRALGRR